MRPGVPVRHKSEKTHIVNQRLKNKEAKRSHKLINLLC